jgi:hypothetical protein
MIRMFLLLCVTNGLVGCGPETGTSVTGSNPEDPTWNGTQSGTATATARSGETTSFIVTYNDDTDDGKVKYTATDRVVLPGASQLGWSYSLDQGKTWKYGGKVRPPAGWGALWGDPAIVNSGTNYQRVYISSLAIPSSKLPPEGWHGYVNDAIGGACVARSDDGGIHFAIHSCLSSNFDFYDGGSMAAAGGLTNDQRVFAAYVDVDAARIDVWASPDGLLPFVQLGNPFPGMTMVSHPRLAYDRLRGGLFVAAINGADQRIYINRLVGDSWEPPKVASLPTSRSTVTVAGQEIRHAYGFSFDVGANSTTELPDGTVQSNADNVRMLYTTRDAETKRLYVRGSACASDLAICNDVPKWGTTPGNLNTPGNQFNPTVKAWIGFIGLPPLWKAAYQSTDDSPDGISIKQGNLAVLPNGSPIFLPFDLIGPKPVCPDYREGSPGKAVDGYWGDYDEMSFAGFDPGTTTPQFLLAFSDSTKGCTQQQKFTSTHLHVRSVVIK